MSSRFASWFPAALKRHFRSSAEPGSDSSVDATRDD
ncbi:transaldolase [Aspergillus luchuensis]|uniref:Transaldolase n=1 Tax=Aspergillus kawachii TaxID=1069201 RepID=A0A146FFD0_ASPKA|nr:transaldolase [Aspergillus luchuensis]